MSRKKIYIILVNYGTPDATIECMESIVANSYQNFQVLIVDIMDINHSEQTIGQWVLKQEDERFMLISEKQNKGFAYANNIAIKYAMAKQDANFIWLLNNDTVIAPDSLGQLLNCYHQSTIQTGFIGSKTMDYTRRELIQNMGGTFNKWSGYSMLKGMGEKDNGQFDNGKLSVDYVVGASMFFHVSLIDKIGLMPEDYLVNYEAIDWCITAKKTGLVNITCQKSVIYHKQGLSTETKLLNKDSNLEIKKHLYQSYLIFYHRHYKALLPVAYFILFKHWAGRVYHKEWREAKMILMVIFTR